MLCAADGDKVVPLGPSPEKAAGGRLEVDEGNVTAARAESSPATLLIDPRAKGRPSRDMSRGDGRAVEADGRKWADGGNSGRAAGTGGIAGVQT